MLYMTSSCPAARDSVCVHVSRTQETEAGGRRCHQAIGAHGDCSDRKLHSFYIIYYYNIMCTHPVIYYLVHFHNYIIQYTI